MDVNDNVIDSIKRCLYPDCEDFWYAERNTNCQNGCGLLDPAKKEQKDAPNGQS